MTSGQSEAKTNAGWLQRFVENNIAVLVCGAAVIWSGFNSSDAVTTQRLNEHDRQLSEISAIVRDSNMVTRDVRNRLSGQTLCEGTDNAD